MDSIFYHFWVFLILGTVINGLVFKYRSRRYTAMKPELSEGYDKIFKGWMFYCNIPWLIMAIADWTNTAEFDAFIMPVSFSNPFVILFYLYWLVVLFLGSRWIYKEGGAGFLARHPGMVRAFFSREMVEKPGEIKLYWTLLLIGSLLGFAAMIFMTFFIRSA